MQRVFTVDIGRFNKGDVRDYSKGTWEQIAENSSKKLGAITTPVEDAARHHVQRGGKR